MGLAHGALRSPVVHGDAYTPSPRGALLRHLDPALIACCVANPSQRRAVIALRRGLREA